MKELQEKSPRIISDRARKLLTDGLLAGYAGETSRETVRRGGQAFGLEASHTESDDGKLTYHDEWRADRTGGGQELIDIFPERDEWTRVYAGGTAKKEILKSLGLTKKDVTGYLKTKLRALGDKTRLDEDCLPEADGDWKYSYLANRYEDIPAVAGIEKIEFRSKIVFVHILGIAPIE